MRVPRPPWRHYGWVGLLVDWIDFEEVKRQLVPDDFEIASFLRSDTLSGHYLGSYTPTTGCTFDRPFHEFGYFACKAEYHDSKGYLPSKIAMDHPEALEGSQDYWGLRKIPGEFEEQGDYGFQVNADDGRLQVSLEFKKLVSLGYWNRSFDSLVKTRNGVLRFKTAFYGELFLCRTKRKRLGHRGTLIPLLFDRCWVTVEKPEIVAR
jgi:hypothetical protein